MSTDLIKKLREETGAGVMDIKEALDEAQGDDKKALELLKTRGLEIVGKKLGREVGAGRVDSYLHGEPASIGVLIELGCETDFVAKNQEFGLLSRNLAMQIASMRPNSIEELLQQDYVREPGRTVQDLINEAIHKFGENIKVRRFVCYKLGED